VNHADIKKHLADYLEGELRIDERALVDAHLDACDSCAGEVNEMLQTIRLLRTLPEPKLPPMIAANVMRRIRTGESQLGFFGRIGRTLGGVLEPGFVLPASAIAAAALVVTVVQSLGGVPTSDMGREDARLSGGGTSSSVASVPSLSTNRRDERARRSRVYGASGAANGRDFAARVERRATQAERALEVARGPGMSLMGVGSGTRIRIKLEGLELAHDSTAQRSRSPIPQNFQFHPGSTSLAGRVPTSQISDQWTTELSGALSRNSLNLASPGRLVVAERLGQGDFSARSGVWPQTAAQGGFLMDSTDTAYAAEAAEAGNYYGRRDPRDVWLALGVEDPVEFARYIAGRNLAEQELWASRLSERAEAQGVLDEFLRALRESGDPTAVWVADDFAARAERTRRRDLPEADAQHTR
jgi:hypothetical protein